MYIFFSHQPLKLVHVRQPQKPSNEASGRTNRRRTREFENIGNRLSGGQVDLHVIAHIKKKSKEERERLLREALGKELVFELPEGETLAMKADLRLTWFRLNKLRRYMCMTFCFEQVSK